MKDAKGDRYFYDTIMCQSSEHPKFGSPDSMKYKKEKGKLYPKSRPLSDSDRTESEYSEEVGSKNMDSSTVESGSPDLKKRGRKGKFGSLAHVVNFMGKSARRN